MESCPSVVCRRATQSATRNIQSLSASGPTIAILGEFPQNTRCMPGVVSTTKTLAKVYDICGLIPAFKYQSQFLVQWG